MLPYFKWINVVCNISLIYPGELFGFGFLKFCVEWLKWVDFYIYFKEKQPKLWNNI